MTPPRILVAGAGIAGLALKHALSAQGIEADIVERDPSPRTSGTGLYLPANAVRALSDLGLSSALSELAVPVDRQEICNRDGRLLAGFGLDEVWGNVGQCMAVRHADLHHILHRAVGMSAVRFGVTVRDVRHDGTVTFDDGTQDRYDLVVGSDGIDSAVRRSVNEHIRPQFLGQVCWRFLAPAGLLVPGIWIARLANRGRTVLTLPVGRGELYCYAAINSRNPEPPPGDWRDLFSDFASPVTDLLAHGRDAYFAALHEIPGDTWVNGHTLLVGDAAHACSPSMAQGGAMAIEDAAVLAGLLSTVRARDVTPSVLEQYRQRRNRRVRFVLQQNRRRDRTRNLPAPVRGALLRRFGLEMARRNHAQLLSPP